MSAVEIRPARREDFHAVTSLLAELGPRAVEHGDEHVIKLAEAAMREYARSGDATVLVAADRFRGKIQHAEQDVARAIGHRKTHALAAVRRKIGRRCVQQDGDGDPDR